MQVNVKMRGQVEPTEIQKGKRSGVSVCEMRQVILRDQNELAEKQEDERSEGDGDDMRQKDRRTKVLRW
jgi:hypothetical protein